MAYTEILFVRHGEADHMGSPDTIVGHSPQSDLTVLGLEQARARGDQWRIADYTPDAVYSSPIWRCRRTARVVMRAAGIDRSVRLDDNLAEMCQGGLEGTTRTPEIAAEMQRLKGKYRAPGFNQIGMPGESFGDVTRRWIAFLGTQSIAAAAENRTRRVAAFSHRTFLGAGISYLDLLSEQPEAVITPDDIRDRYMETRTRLPIPPCSTTLVVVEPRSLSEPENFRYEVEHVGQLT